MASSPAPSSTRFILLLSADACAMQLCKQGLVTKHSPDERRRRAGFSLRCSPRISRSLSLGGAEPVIGRAFARPVGADPLAHAGYCCDDPCQCSTSPVISA